MLKKPLRSPVSVLKNLKAGTSKIHRNSLLPLRTFENCFKKKKKKKKKPKKTKTKTNQQGRNLNSETKCKSQIWWFSVTMGEFPRGVGWEGVGWSEMVSLVGFYVSPIFSRLPHPSVLLYSALHHHPPCLKSIVSDYHVTTAR